MPFSLVVFHADSIAQCNSIHAPFSSYNSVLPSLDLDVIEFRTMIRSLLYANAGVTHLYHYFKWLLLRSSSYFRCFIFLVPLIIYQNSEIWGNVYLLSMWLMGLALSIHISLKLFVFY